MSLCLYCSASGARDLEREQLTSAFDFLLKVTSKFGVWPGVALALDEVFASRAVSLVAHNKTELTERASRHSSTHHFKNSTIKYVMI